MENKKKEPRGFYVEKGSFFAHASVIVLVFSIVARLLGTLNLWSDMNQLMIQTLLPVGSALLFILFILLLGRVALWTTILPVLGGAAFFILSALEKEPLQLFTCIALGFLAAFIYTATLTGMIRTKWILVPVFALILAYQIIFHAIPVFGNTEEPVSFLDGMTLLSSLGLVFAMLCASLAIRRKKAAKPAPELPKIKDPKVVPPAAEPDKPEETAGEGETSAAAEAADSAPVPDAAPTEPVEYEAPEGGDCALPEETKGE